MEKINRIPVPVIDGSYRRVYTPQPDIYNGENTAHFRHGTRYDDWIVNDFTVLFRQDGWHAIGITHPRPPRVYQ